jgi:acetylornithine/N-succinyldiaminopimelate aminotransferase
MNLFDVYPLFDITPARAQGSWLWDDKGQKYLDLYGGHAVISIGHSHPHYIKALTDQLNKIGFYSNSVRNPLQLTFAEKLGQLSGYPDYQLFLCNSGAEANENALKVASFLTGRKKIIAFKKAFHGRTSGAVAASDNPKIVAPFNEAHDIVFLPLNDEAALVAALDKDVAAVIIEGIQGVGGIQIPHDSFLQFIEAQCATNGSMLILDEIQSGYGRTGKFFAHQFATVRPHLITTAKGMGNGFPIGGVLIHPDIKPWSGMLGTTFGGNYLAMAAGLAVLEVIEKEDLLNNVVETGRVVIEALKGLRPVNEIRGRGFMIGIDLPETHRHVRSNLIHRHRIFTGESKPNVVRLLPSLATTKQQMDMFLVALEEELRVAD